MLAAITRITRTASAMPMHDPVTINVVDEAFEAWQTYLEKVPELKTRDMKFIFDEWGTRYRSAPGTRGDFQRLVEMVTPLSSAFFLHEVFRHSDMVGASCPTGSPSYPLDFVAALPGDRTKLILSVVNPTEKSQAFAPQIRGIKLRSAGKLSQIAAPSVNANNEAGKEPEVGIVESAQPTLPETVHVPSLSESVYEFEIETARPFGKNQDAGHGSCV
jgi:alpha-L-arabinofuranosidase